MKQTSIEWFSHEVFKILNYQLEGNIPAIIAGLNMMEAKYKALEMYKQEMKDTYTEEEVRKAIDSASFYIVKREHSNDEIIQSLKQK